MYKDLLAGLGRFYEQESIDGEAIFGVRLPLALAYALLCTVAFFVSRVILPVLSKTYQGLSRQARIDWDNRIVAMGHAIIMSYRVFHYWTYVNPLFPRNFSAITVAPLLDFYEKDTMRLMTGYMIYDLIVELLTPAVYDYAVLFHHIAGLLSHWHTLQTNDVASGWYTMLVYCAEGSTPILHMGWMMNTCGMADGLAFKIMTLALILTFFVVRIMLSPLLAYTYLAPGNRHLYKGRDGVWAFQLFIVFAFSSLNFFWFYKLISLILKRLKGGKIDGDGGVRVKKESVVKQEKARPQRQVSSKSKKA